MAEDNLALVQGSDPETDFESIHDAFMDSERGRWFLVEFARRNRHADTALLLAAIGRIESILLAQRAAGGLPAPRQDPAAFANPAAIKPDGNDESKGEVLRVLGESAARLREAINGLRDVSWSMREQGDMRCEVIDRQAVGIAQTVAAFDALRETLGGADGKNSAPLPAAPVPQAAKAPVFTWPAAPEAPAADTRPAVERPTAAEPPPAQNFASAPLLETLPPAEPPAPEEVAAAIEAPADDPFADMLFDADAVPAETPAQSIAAALEAQLPDASIEGPFDSSQARRLTRLINLFAGARAADAAPADHDTAPIPAESLTPAAPPAQPKAPSEPADFLLEPWPQVSVQPEPAAEAAPPQNAEPAPVVKAVTTSSPAVSAASLFPMSRPAPSDPLAPIVALSDEEKIALFS